MKQYICIDIGGTAIKYGVVQSGEIPEIIQTDSCKTPENGTKILRKVFDIIEGLKRRRQSAFPAQELLIQKRAVFWKQMMI